MASLRRVCNVLVMAMAIWCLQQAAGARIPPDAPLDGYDASIRILNQLTAPLGMQCDASNGKHVVVGGIPVNDMGTLRFTASQQRYWKCELIAPALGLRGYFTLWTDSPSFSTGAHPAFLANKDGLYKIPDANRPGLGPRDGILLYHWRSPPDAPLDDNASIRILNQLSVPLAVQCDDSNGKHVDVGAVPVNDMSTLVFTLYQQRFWKCSLMAPALRVRGYFTLWASSPSFNPGAHPSFLATFDGLYQIPDANRPGVGPQDGILLYRWH